MNRIPCQIVGCRKTADALKVYPDVLIICYQHFPLANKSLRRRYGRIKRLIKRLPEDDPLRTRAAILAWRMWERIETQCQQRSKGI